MSPSCLFFFHFFKNDKFITQKIPGHGRESRADGSDIGPNFRRYSELRAHRVHHQRGNSDIEPEADKAYNEKLGELFFRSFGLPRLESPKLIQKIAVDYGRRKAYALESRIRKTDSDSRNQNQKIQDPQVNQSI